MVCTKILGRGLDVRNLNFVINFDLPWRMVEYVHRIGRAGRWGQRGFALTLLEELDLRNARDLIDVLVE